MPDRRIVLAVMAGLSLALIGVYVFWGLTPENWGYNFPRRMKIIAAVILVSCATGWSSLVFQTVTANHILTPGIIGLESLYLFLQTAIVFFIGSRQLLMMRDVPSFLLSIMLMAGLATMLFKLMLKGREQNVYFLVLTGLVFGTLFSGLADFMQVLIDPSEYSVLEGRMFASFNKINLNLMGLSAGLVGTALALSLRDLKYLDVLTLGRNHAVALGVEYQSLVLRTMIFVAVMVSVSTVLVGPIIFLGLLVVSLTRALMKTYRHRILLPGTILVSIAILTFGLLVTERTFQFRTPLSVMINLVGGVYFIFLLLKVKNA